VSRNILHFGRQVRTFRKKLRPSLWGYSRVLRTAVCCCSSKLGCEFCRESLLIWRVIILWQCLSVKIMTLCLYMNFTVNVRPIVITLLHVFFLQVRCVQLLFRCYECSNTCLLRIHKLSPVMLRSHQTVHVSFSAFPRMAACRTLPETPLIQETFKTLLSCSLLTVFTLFSELCVAFSSS
jgi:hypothetical protein